MFGIGASEREDCGRQGRQAGRQAGQAGQAGHVKQEKETGCHER